VSDFGFLPPFGSDNYAPAHPEVLAAVGAANDGFAVAYGDDPWTARLDDCVAALFGPGTRAFPVFNGTGANVISLMAVAPRWGGVLAAADAHAHTDENGAPERIGGLKMLTAPGSDGRLAVADVEAWAGRFGDVHRTSPAVLSLTQSTELGTVYRVAQLRELTEAAHKLGMAVHIDGARLANAAAFLNVGLAEITSEVGVDLISLGAAKNGGLLGEAVVVMPPDAAPTEAAADARRLAAESIPFLRKYTGQLASKQRFIAAQLLALFGGDLWLRNAVAANAAAQRLRAGVMTLGGEVVRPSRPTEANAVFVTLPRTVADALRTRAPFYDWAGGETPDRVEARWMCSWATTDAQVDGFLAALADCL